MMKTARLALAALLAISINGLTALHRRNAARSTAGDFPINNAIVDMDTDPDNTV